MSRSRTPLARTGRNLSPVAASRPVSGRSSPHLPATIDPPGPASTSSDAAAGDRRGIVDVGADFYSASELAQLKLDGLPDRREHIARRATRERWPHRDRTGKGGGREFPLSALPAKARGDLLRRRLERNALEATGKADAPVAPLEEFATLRSRQAERFAARSALLDAFDGMRAGRSARSTMKMFLAAWAEGQVELPEWTKPLLRERLSEKTLKRWRAARTAGKTEALAGRWPGVLSVFERSPELAEWLIGAHVRQPALSAKRLTRLMGGQFPEGAPDARGVMLPLPAFQSVGRFLREWKANPANALALAAVNDPDGYRSKFRVAFGRAGTDVVRPNQQWQIDASPADVLCAEPDGNWGRYSIYVLVDVFSRRMMALVTKTPKTAASLLLVARACRAWGVPELLVTDNGTDFKSKHFTLAVRQLGVALRHCKPYSPEHKAFVERGIGTVQHGFMPLIEGYIGHNVAARAEIESRTAFAHRLGESEDKLMRVSVTAVELQELLDGWIANDYERAPHSGLGATPLAAWNNGVAEHPQRFAHPQAIGALLMPPVDRETRVVGRKGVRVDGIEYVSPTLLVGQRVQVRLDPDDLGTVWLYTDTDPWEFLGVAENVELKGLDRAEVAAKARAIQDAFAKEARAELRRLARQSNVYDLAARMMRGDNAPAPIVEFTHTTPALEAAARAVAERAGTPRPRRVLPEISEEQREAHRDFVADFDQPEEREETGAERYDRWLRLKAMHDRGEPIPDEHIHWFNDYPTTGEWRGQRLMRGHDDGDPL
jgi:transposase InsO family protein